MSNVDGDTSACKAQRTGDGLTSSGNLDTPRRCVYRKRNLTCWDMLLDPTLPSDVEAVVDLTKADGFHLPTKMFGSIPFVF
ncbi:hypothetical protein 18India_34 [Salmonella phage 18-India]|nr:hypothetical protein 18India_34 [Salmonella phage 18-India]